jgi:ATP-dependent DNA helicase RecQ
MPTDEAAVERLGRGSLGFESLRLGQLRAVAAAAAGRDVLAVLPTGGGKSAIYELAGMIREGPTVVVSPLIALQDDQLAHLRSAGLGAIVLNSQQSPREHAAALAGSCRPESFVFCSPEQLSNAETREVLQRARPGLFAVDEAHLVSQWGHDFRTDYLRLGAQADALAVPVRVALTATASPPVRHEISRRLGLRDPDVVIGDFDRPDISLAARRVRTQADKLRELTAAAAGLGGAGIVYAATHAGAEAAREALATAGESVALYHAGLSPRTRRDAMSAFLDGSVRIVAATVAFGMGIDKPDVRRVVHVDPPPSLDAYYQEIGRAGRDGEAAHAQLLYRAEDFGAAVHFHLARRLTRLCRACGRDARVGRRGPADARNDGRARPSRRRRCRGVGRRRRRQLDGELTLAAALSASDAETKRENEIERSRLEMMRRYGEPTGCRRSFLLSYFGQAFLGRCGNCDNDATAAAVAPAVEPFAIGERVVSERWGEGTVQRYDGDQLTVLFDDYGYRDLLVPLVVERGLLRPGSGRPVATELRTLPEYVV